LATKALDHYRTLGVSRNAKLPAIKAAGRELIKQHHPDLAPSSGGVASSRCIAILDALAILTDPHLRAQHDALVAAQQKLPKLAEPPPSRAVAVARGAFALFQLSVYAAAGLLALLVLVAIVVEVSLGK
jgi:DnaJ-class molecular chaperone